MTILIVTKIITMDIKSSGNQTILDFKSGALPPRLEIDSQPLDD